MGKFNNLDMEPHWDPHISGTELYRAIKMKMVKEKFDKNQSLK